MQGIESGFLKICGPLALMVEVCGFLIGYSKVAELFPSVIRTLDCRTKIIEDADVQKQVAKA